MVSPDMCELKKSDEFEEVTFISGPLTETCISLRINSVGKKTEIENFETHDVPCLPVMPSEHLVNSQNESSEQKLDLAFTGALCRSGQCKPGNGSSKRRSSIRRSSKNWSSKRTSNIRISSKSRSSKGRSSKSRSSKRRSSKGISSKSRSSKRRSSKRRMKNFKYWHLSIAIGLSFYMLPVVHALPESRKDDGYGSLTTCTCSFKWQLSTDHIVKINGNEVGMCNHYCHKTEEEMKNEKIILKKDGNVNLLEIKSKSCADVRVTIVLTGHKEEETVPQSGDSCAEKLKNGGQPAINIQHVWIWPMIIALCSIIIIA
ncbi:uncharacterized protein LOC127876327 [Dreissena polymorpha]|uniref:Uncharacterized protein n=1 Tax=Dreissena polymorpha TaxID=45954 RepID=A0A9D4K0M3_DREPO|nr:uncharacterized protein LOC127876327 [Dreissena polymorpha]XP_052277397.1 uncharacterized protein LOC127876327 [Dreissena polymorpha]KAH3831830.1 hypothetical protein DPMN_105101 [Dreissena polymorpha]